MKPVANIFCGVVLLLAAPAFAGSSHRWLYWAEKESSTIKRVRLDGSGVEILYSAMDGVSNPIGLALDPDAGHVYWTQDRRINKGSMDGTLDPVTIVSPTSVLLTELVVDPIAGTMYWISADSIPFDFINKANLDGSGIQQILLGGQSPTSLAIDPAGGKLYWALAEDYACEPAKIQRSGLDGADVEDVVTGLKYVTALAVDGAAGKLYWAEQCGMNSIRRRDLAGGEIQTLVPEFGQGIALDPVANKMYWTRLTPEPDAIRRANLDGACVEDIASIGVQLPLGIDLVPAEHVADLNDDGIVTGLDLAILLGAWGPCAPADPCGCGPDLNHNGLVNGLDLALLLGSWG